MTSRLIAGLLLLTACARAQSVTAVPVAPRFFNMTEPQIAKALKKIHKDHQDLKSRVEAVSAAFLGIPYKLGPMGEGDGAGFDGDPIYSFKQLDCTTSVEEIMALSINGDLDSALHDTLQRIRYKGGKVDYFERNHFTEADWVPNNVAAGYLVDITREVAGTLARDASKNVSKRDWYARKTVDAIKGFPNDSQAEREKRLKDLQSRAGQFQDQVSTIPYVPMASFASVLSSIPSGTIANLIRADQPGKPTIVSHQVLIVDKGGTMFVREAAYGKEFLDVPALDYFQKYNGSSWPLLGLNLNEIRDPGRP